MIRLTGPSRSRGSTRHEHATKPYTERWAGDVVTAARFFLGTHQPGWLAKTRVPLFVSDRRLRGYRTLPRATCTWALDSGGFTELSTFGTWLHGPTPQQYAARVRRYRDEIGGLEWAAPQDWMCEPVIVAKTGLSVTEHQRRTVDNYLQLRDLAPDLPFVPVVQGWSTDDYLRCVDLYTAAGIDLTDPPATDAADNTDAAVAPMVGLGSVCRRQATGQAEDIVNALHSIGVTRLHGFGIKVLGLHRYGHRLASADSMAWSFSARRSAPLPGCTTHSNCANCHRYALAWREQVLAAIPAHQQLCLFDTTPPVA